MDCDLKTVKKVSWVTARILMILTLLYFFICSLDLLSVAFRLLSGKATGGLFGSESFLANPIVGLMIGILGTVLLQSSSTFTSIIISMIGTIITDPEIAVPMIMGSNIGTSVTNTIVSLTQVANRDEFRRAFAAATVHDMFNWCSVIVMLTIEIVTKAIFGVGFLYFICEKMSASLFHSQTSGGEVKILKYITEPFTDLIVQTDSDLIGEWALGQNLNCTMVVHYCPQQEVACWDAVKPFCKHMFAHSSLEDWEVGLILLFLSLFILCGALLIMVKILNSLLKGAIAVAVKKVLNPTFKHSFLNYAWGYVNILVGAFLTFIVQSSSVFTSTMTPLVGIGLLTVETVYPLFLGSNIGTTTTALLAALAKDSGTIKDSITIAFVHLFFNLFGILIFYPIPFMRIPIPLCQLLGKTTAKYRWFAILYLVVMFLLLPAFIMVTSLNMIVFLVLNIPLLLLLIFAVVVNAMQSHKGSRKWLPKVLQTWDFLPKPLHSLGYYDRIVSEWSCCKKYRNTEGEEPEKVEGEKHPDLPDDHHLNSLEKTTATNDRCPESGEVAAAATVSLDNKGFQSD